MKVIAALREAGLESSNLILGIDFTKSNEWSGNVTSLSFSLHIFCLLLGFLLSSSFM
jgi:E3 ubiquitin-protein ligase RGLG